MRSIVSQLNTCKSNTPLKHFWTLIEAATLNNTLSCVVIVWLCSPYPFDQAHHGSRAAGEVICSPFLTHCKLRSCTRSLLSAYILTSLLKLTVTLHSSPFSYSPFTHNHSFSDALECLSTAMMCSDKAFQITSLITNDCTGLITIKSTGLITIKSTGLITIKSTRLMSIRNYWISELC
jgi:hypothetical protein